jgi:hypothetical protein
VSQHDFSIANQTASSARTDINNALQALASCSSGATAPSTTYANMLWYDTANNTLKIRNEADSAWLSVAYVDQTDGAEIFDDTKVVNSSGTQTGLIGDQAEATWETGTGTTESLVSPAKVKAAIAANTSTGVGISQSWQSVSRSVGTSYQNTTGQPIMVNVGIGSGGEKYGYVSTDNSSWIQVFQGQSNQTLETASFIVPDDHYYKMTWSQAGSLSFWSELR